MFCLNGSKALSQTLWLFLNCLSPLLECLEASLVNAAVRMIDYALFGFIAFDDNLF